MDEVVKVGGRPTKYNPDRHNRIIEALRAGNTRKASAMFGGVSVDAFQEWVKIYPEFSQDVERAEAEAEIRNVAIIQKAATDTWQAAAWWLERRRPGDYRTRSEVTGADGGAVRVVVEYAAEIPISS